MKIKSLLSYSDLIVAFASVTFSKYFFYASLVYFVVKLHRWLFKGYLSKEAFMSWKLAAKNMNMNNDQKKEIAGWALRFNFLIIAHAVAAPFVYMAIF